MSAAGGPAPPIGPHEMVLFLAQLALLLLAAVVLGRLAVRLRMPAVVGELLAGVLLGPSAVGTLWPGLFPAQGEQPHLLDGVGQFGMLLLVAFTGAQLDLTLIRRRSTTAGVVGVGALLVPLGFGLVTGFLLPDQLFPGSADRGIFALFVGVTMCVSALPVIAKTLTDMGLLHRDVGQLILASGTIDDAFGWLLLSVVSVLTASSGHPSSVVLSLVWIVAVLLFTLVLGRPLVALALRWPMRSESAGPLVAVSVVLVLAGATGTLALGMEPMFGAFLMGVLIGTTPGLDPSRLAPLNTTVLFVLAPIFLGTAGLRVDLAALASLPVLIAAIATLVVAIVGKFIGAYAGARACRMTHWEALALGAGLNSRGVVEIVVAMAGLRLGVISQSFYTIVVLVAVLTSVLAPWILRIACARIARTNEESRREQVTRAWVGKPAYVTEES